MFGHKATLPIDLELWKKTSEEVLQDCVDHREGACNDQVRGQGEDRRKRLELVKGNIEKYWGCTEKAEGSIWLQTSYATALQSWRTGPSQGSHLEKVQGRETWCSMAWTIQNPQTSSSRCLCSFQWCWTNQKSCRSPPQGVQSTQLSAAFQSTTAPKPRHLQLHPEPKLWLFKPYPEPKLRHLQGHSEPKLRHL